VHPLNTTWNPVGSVLTRQELITITSFCERRHLALISDEIYEAIVYDGHEHISPLAVAPQLRDRCILINSLSKTYSMTGWRVGYCAGPAPLISAMLLVLQQSSRGPATFIQDAAAEALAGPQDCVTEMRQEYARRREQTLAGLDGIPAVRTLPRELEARIEGEVRFDKISRALYSTDASVYQIEPLGVVVAKTREDILRALEICRRHRCPLTMRGGGTSQGGQAIGHGLQIDTSKYYSHVLEINAEERWARVEPGLVLDELNAQLAPLGLRFAPDISTASRATIGGMMANNSSGARSVLYGKTIDHVLEQIVALSDGSIAYFRDVRRSEVREVGQADSL